MVISVTISQVINTISGELYNIVSLGIIQVINFTWIPVDRTENNIIKYAIERTFIDIHAPVDQ